MGRSGALIHPVETEDDLGATALMKVYALLRSRYVDAIRMAQLLALHLSLKPFQAHDVYTKLANLISLYKANLSIVRDKWQLLTYGRCIV